MIPPLNTNKQRFPISSKWCEVDFAHPHINGQNPAPGFLGPHYGARASDSQTSCDRNSLTDFWVYWNFFLNKKVGTDPTTTKLLGVDSPFFSAIVLFKNQPFLRMFGGFLEKRIPPRNLALLRLSFGPEMPPRVELRNWRHLALAVQHMKVCELLRIFLAQLVRTLLTGAQKRMCCAESSDHVFKHCLKHHLARPLHHPCGRGKSERGLAEVRCLLVENYSNSRGWTHSATWVWKITTCVIHCLMPMTAESL